MSILNRKLLVVLASLWGSVYGGVANAATISESKVWFVPPPAYGPLNVQIYNLTGEPTTASIRWFSGGKLISNASVSLTVGPGQMNVRNFATPQGYALVIATRPVIVLATSIIYMVPDHPATVTSNFASKEQVATYPIDCSTAGPSHFACGQRAPVVLNPELDGTAGGPDGPGGGFLGPETRAQPSGAAIRTDAGLCLDARAPNRRANGGRVQVWACNGAPQQTWTYDPASNAVRVSSGLCLDVDATQIATNGGRVQVGACNGARQQQWTPLKNGSLRNAGGLCLDVHAPDQRNNGGRVQVWQCNGSQQQRFTSSVF